MCLYPALTSAAQPTASCPSVPTSSSSLSVSWTEPQVTAECQNLLYAFPTLCYLVTYHVSGLTDEVTNKCCIIVSSHDDNSIINNNLYTL